jgi:hypothetical protein
MKTVHLATLALLGAAAAGLARAAPEGPKLSFPLACQIGRTCEIQHYVDRDPGPGVLDYRCGRRTYEAHGGVDIRLLDMQAQKRGVEVLAAAAGRVARLRDGVPDVSVRTTGIASVEGRECGNGVVIDHGDGWETQYCHMAQGSIVVKVGQQVAAGAPLGRVGLSGQTEFPHLHLTVRHAGKIVDPFAPAAAGGCQAQPGMWTAQAAQQLAYKAGAILNTGFAAAPVTMASIESGDIAPPTAASGMLITYIRAIELQKGDQVELTLRAPGGQVIATHRNDPLDADKAQQFYLVGRKRPAAGWPTGTYSAEFRVWRGGKVALQRTITTRL